MLTGPHIVFAGGTLLGNLYPGLAIARRFQQRMPAAHVTFAGDGRAVERHLIRGEGFHYVAMPSKPAPQGPIEAVRFVTDNVAGFWASRWMVREQRVSLVVGMGGCASSAVVRAAHGAGIPFILLEQDAAPSRTARRMAHAAEAVCGAFEALRPHLPVDAPFMLTGVPGRPAFEALADQSAASRRQRSARNAGGFQRRLVVLGGVGGASTLNHAAPEALGELASELGDWQVVHQTGEGQLQTTEDLYRKHGVEALAVTHIDGLASVLEETDLVLCRAGGSMLAELSLAGVPAILAPLAAEAGGAGQRLNADLFHQQTGCPVVAEDQGLAAFTASLQQELRLLLADAARRSELAARIAEQARPEAAERIAEIACDILCGSAATYAA